MVGDTAGDATWHENALVPIDRDGQMEDVYWTYGYSPVRDDMGLVAGVLVVCSETTAAVRADEARALHLATAGRAQVADESLEMEAEMARARLADLVRQCDQRRARSHHDRHGATRHRGRVREGGWTNPGRT